MQQVCPVCGELGGDIPVLYEVAIPDSCLGVIPGVSHACCGHGDVDKAYVVIGGPENCDANGETYRSLTLRGADAVEFFAMAKRGKVKEIGEDPNSPILLSES
jgi:hypothetical protein